MSKEFSKSDLQTGMILEFRNGATATVLLKTNYGDIYVGEAGWCPIDSLCKDLRSKKDKNCDVINIYQPKVNLHYLENIEAKNFANTSKYNLLWQR